MTSMTAARRALQDLTEGNCPLYVIRAAALHRHLRALTNANAQEQYYLTDIIESIQAHGGDIRTVTISVADPEYDLLCSDVTRPTDLALLESIVAAKGSLLSSGSDLDLAARAVQARSASIASAILGIASTSTTSPKPAR